MKIYVILKSWNDVLYKLEAWSRNYYLARVYYEQYSRKHPDSLFRIYDENGSLQSVQLLCKLKKEFDTDTEEFIDTELKLTASKDNKLCAIYKTKYSESFNTDKGCIISEIYDEIRHKVSMTFLSSAPLEKFIYTSIDLMEVLFKAYHYTSVKYNNTILDPVYTWFYLLNADNIEFISNFHRDIIPIDSVFIRVDEY